MQSIVNALNVAGPFTLRWFILCDVNLTQLEIEEYMGVLTVCTL